MRLSFRSELPNHTPEEVFDWHERAGALERLTPPWGKAEVLHRAGGIKDGGRVSLRVRRGLASFRWDLKHRGYEYGRAFGEEQVDGPMRSWVHNHSFAVGPGGVGTVTEDDIELEPPLGSAGAVMAPRLIRSELERMFRFRYQRLFTDLARHSEHAARPKLAVAITGSSGLVGRSLRHFLTTGGHEVVPIVRDSRHLKDGAIFWNPRTGVIDEKGLTRVDAVVHLGGAPIAPGRWTEARKRSIKQSRVQGTDLLARTLATMRNGPRTLISSSAVGFYGDHGADKITEAEPAGKGFLAEVCRAWEGATRPAERAGIRVVTLRTGVVLSPEGGALSQMLPPFKIGAGGRLGSGKQFMSWIDLDDLVGLILHLLYDDSLRGPVNATSPHPVTNATFVSALGRTLGRPTIVPIPGLAVRAALGQLGTEALLWGQRAIPEKMSQAGFEYFYDGVENSLRFQLGKTES